MGDEIVLFANEPHSGRAVGLDRGAEIAFDELAAEMQRLRLDYLDIAGRVQRAGNAGNDDHRHHDDEHGRHDDDPPILGAGYNLFGNDTVRERSLQGISRWLSQWVLAAKTGGNRRPSSR